MYYIDTSISKNKLMKFLKKCTNGPYSEIHSMQMYQGDKMLLKIDIPPYTSDQACQVYSLSKSFTSTAIGILYDNKKIRLNDKVCDIFGIDAPSGSNIALLEVCHLLSMSAGHEECSMESIKSSNDGVKAFFEQELSYKPGEHFTYDTGASWLLSAIVSKISGMTMFDYLNENLFMPLDITDCAWNTSGGNISEGGIGLIISTDDLIKVARMYLNNGIYEGKRILSEEWIKTASEVHIDNSENGTANWRVGYGYQMWMNDCGGYRGDGAFGQYLIVMPEQNIAFAAISESEDMEKQMDDIFAFLTDYKAETEEEHVDIESFVQSVYNPNAIAPNVEDSYYRLDSNLAGFTSCRVHTADDALIMTFSDGKSLQTVSAGFGKWLKNSIEAPFIKPVLPTLMPHERYEKSEFFASCRQGENNSVIIDIRYINTPHHMTIKASFGKDMQMSLYQYIEKLYHKKALTITGRVK